MMHLIVLWTEKEAVIFILWSCLEAEAFILHIYVAHRVKRLEEYKAQCSLAKDTIITSKVQIDVQI